MAKLSTHVLDLARGVPAAGVRVALYRLSEGGSVLAGEAVTNADGRTAESLLAAPELAAGVYEIVFHAGDYFRSNGVSLTEPPFLDEVVIRFGVAAGTASYHVPLLLSPYGYSTYRGS
ncbi:MAG: hydroxyisourate hydrolase [Candidatus Solibacter sp.]